MDNIIIYDRSDTEVWVTDFVFYYLVPEKIIVPKGTEGARLDKFDNWYINKPIEKIVPDMLCKRIPVKYVIKEMYAYLRATQNLKQQDFEIDPETGLLKFKIIYKKFITKININQ